MATLYVRNFPDGLYQWLKKRAAERGITLRELVIEIVEQGLRDEELAERDRNR
jgi:plasmid stability protein